MVNPLALGMMALGIMLLLCGLVLIAKRIKTAGIVISVVGLGAMAIPWLVSLYLSAVP
jgi:hypothetical protein